MSVSQERDSAEQAAKELWRTVTDDFENKTLHQKFIDFCTTTQQLPFAGEQYRAYREKNGESPLIDECMKKILVSAQLQYLPHRGSEKSGTRSPLSRLFSSTLLLLTGFLLIFLWISFPSVRVFIFVGGVILVGYLFYRAKTKY